MMKNDIFQDNTALRESLIKVTDETYSNTLSCIIKDSMFTNNDFMLTKLENTALYMKNNTISTKQVDLSAFVHKHPLSV